VGESHKLTCVVAFCNPTVKRHKICIFCAKLQLENYKLAMAMHIIMAVAHGVDGTVSFRFSSQSPSQLEVSV